MYELLGTQSLVTGQGAVDIMACWVSVLGLPPPGCLLLHWQAAFEAAAGLPASRPPLPRGGLWE
eukprot:12045012-Alexandrium_andersonii.AAC.1